MVNYLFKKILQILHPFPIFLLCNLIKFSIKINIMDEKVYNIQTVVMSTC